MKKLYLLSTLTLVMSVFLSQNASAQNFYQVCNTGQCLHYQITNYPEVSVVEGGCLTGDLIIPTTVFSNGLEYTVTSIYNNAFMGCSGLTSVIIPNTITAIGNNAFSGCSGLTSINIPDAVISIGENAFYNCCGLTSVHIPNSVESIAGNVFSCCSNLINISVDTNNLIYDSRSNCNAIIRKSDNSLLVGCQNTSIPNSITSIGWSAFYGCNNLTSINIPNSVTTIGGGAFSGCSNLTSIVIPSSVLWIGGSVFRNCTNLTSVNIPSSVVNIMGDNIFGGCTNLSSISVDANNPKFDSRGNCNAIIRKTDNMLIAGCQNTTIPNSVTSIQQFAFSGCSGLSSINIPNSIISIGTGAFENCTGLYSINIPNSVTYIGPDAFEGCTNLTSAIIPSSVTSIEGYTFGGCNNLTSVNIPSSITSIGPGAFKGCSSLTSINIPYSVTEIYGNIFPGCSGLSSITVDVNNPVYDSRNNCNAIVRKSDNVLIVGCKNTLIPNNITSIGTEAFQECGGLTSINIPNSVTSFGPSVFYGCSDLTSINIPNSVTSIGANAFSGCNSLTSISIPNSVTSIGSNAFSGCSNLTSVNIPNSITSIGYYFFRDCNSLTSINIPNSITSIGNDAFLGCSNLISITVDANNTIFDSRDSCNAIIRSWNNTLIVGCQNTVIPASVSTIDNHAFSNCFINSDSLICLSTTPPVLNGCVCSVFGDVSQNFKVYVPCGTTAAYETAWEGDINFHGFEEYDTSFTVITDDTCYLWNNIPYCTSGDYTQTFTAANGCDSIVTLHLTLTVGINDHNLGASMTVYPNPTNSIVNVECTMNNVQAGSVEFQLFDAFGRLIRITDGVETRRAASLQADTHGSSVQTAQIDLSGFAAGIYFVKAVTDGNVVAVRKIIKN